MGTVTKPWFPSDDVPITQLSPTSVFKGKQLARTPPSKVPLQINEPDTERIKQEECQTLNKISEKCEDLSSTFVCTPSINLYHPMLVPDSNSVYRMPTNYIPKGREIKRTPPTCMLNFKNCVKETIEAPDNILKLSHKADSETSRDICTVSHKNIVPCVEKQHETTCKDDANLIPKGRQLMRTPPNTHFVGNVADEEKLKFKHVDNNSQTHTVQNILKTDNSSQDISDKNTIPRGKQLMRTPPSSKSAFDSPVRNNSIPSPIERTPKLLYVNIGQQRPKYPTSLKRNIIKNKTVLNGVAGNPLRKHLYKKKCQNSAEKTDIRSWKSRTISERKHSFEQELLDDLTDACRDKNKTASPYGSNNSNKLERTSGEFASTPVAQVKGNYFPRGKELARTPPNQVFCINVKTEPVDSYEQQAVTTDNQYQEKGMDNNKDSRVKLVSDLKENRSFANDVKVGVNNQNQTNSSTSGVYNCGHSMSSVHSSQRKITENSGVHENNSAVFVDETNLDRSDDTAPSDAVSSDPSKFVNDKITEYERSNGEKITHLFPDKAKSAVDRERHLESNNFSLSGETKKEQDFNGTQHEQRKTVSDTSESCDMPSLSSPNPQEQQPVENLDQVCENLSSIQVTPKSQTIISHPTSPTKNTNTFAFSLPGGNAHAEHNGVLSEEKNGSDEIEMNLEQKLKLVNLESFDSPYRRFAQRVGRGGKMDFKFSIQSDRSAQKNVMAGEEETWNKNLDEPLANTEIGDKDKMVSVRTSPQHEDNLKLLKEQNPKLENVKSAKYVTEVSQNEVKNTKAKKTTSQKRTKEREKDSGLISGNACKQEEVMDVPRRRGRRKVEQENSTAVSVAEHEQVPRVKGLITEKSVVTSSTRKLTRKINTEEKAEEELPKTRGRRKVTVAKNTHNVLEPEPVEEEIVIDESCKVTQVTRRPAGRPKKPTMEKENIPETTSEDLTKMRSRKKAGQEPSASDVQKRKEGKSEKGLDRKQITDSSPIAEEKTADLASTELPKRRGRQKNTDKKMTSNSEVPKTKSVKFQTQESVDTDGCMDDRHTKLTRRTSDISHPSVTTKKGDNTTNGVIQTKSGRRKAVERNSDKSISVGKTQKIEIPDKVTHVEGRQRRVLKTEAQTQKVPDDSGVTKVKGVRASKKNNDSSETVRRSTRIAGKTKHGTGEDDFESTLEVLATELMKIFTLGLAVYLILNYQQEK